MIFSDFSSHSSDEKEPFDKPYSSSEEDEY